MHTPAVQEPYLALVEAMRDLGAALIPATAAQFEAPPRSRKTKEAVSESKGVRNPTLDTVLDARRMALSDAVKATEVALRLARSTITPHTEALRLAVARWEGLEGTPE